MSLDIPTNPEQLENQSLADLQRYLPNTANPFLQESWMGAQSIANARRLFDLYKQMQILALEAIPITAVELLEQWSSFWGIYRNPATVANGNVVITGLATTVIPVATPLTSTNGLNYTTAAEVVIQNTVISCTITSVGTLATVTLGSNVSMFDGLSVTIAGAVQTAYNGTFSITVTATNKFTYVMATTAVSPATGTITSAFVIAVAAVQSVGFGQTQNQSPNAKLSFASPISGAATVAYVDQGAIGGGTDIESDSSLRSRLLDRVQNPIAHFNAAEIKAVAKRVSGVTDVYVYEITPALGQVTVYFIRGNDSSPIPDGSEVTAVKNELLTILPANTAVADLIVSAPTAVPLNVTLTALSPNTSTMQKAITANIKAMLLDQGIVGVPITLNQLIATIQDTIDTSNGASVVSFTMTLPVGNVGGGTGEYVVFNSVIYP